MAICDPGIIRRSGVYVIEEGSDIRTNFPYHIIDTRTNTIVASFFNYRLAEWVLTMVGVGEMRDLLTGRKVK